MQVADWEGCYRETKPSQKTKKHSKRVIIDLVIGQDIKPIIETQEGEDYGGVKCLLGGGSSLAGLIDNRPASFVYVANRSKT